jgi:hypothetical protein
VSHLAAATSLALVADEHLTSKAALPAGNASSAELLLLLLLLLIIIIIIGAGIA